MYESKILGVCLWLSKKFDMDVGHIRIVFLAAAIFGMGVPVLLYLALAFLKPNPK